MKLMRLCVTLLIVVYPAHGFADNSEQEAIRVQLAAAMASADYAAKNCPNLQIDRTKLKALIERSGKSEKQLRASDDYAEQRDVIVNIEKSPQAVLICQLLPMAHNGYARGIIK
jgi:hypothetical protein